MSALVLEPSLAMPGERVVSELRATAYSDANRFRALAWIALKDGSPRGDLRASNARAAARSVLRHAKSLGRTAIEQAV